jgi:hypothetical protein
MGEGALDSLIRKALQIAESSDDADEMLKAFRLYQAVDRQKQKEAAKTRSRGAVQAARIIAPCTAIIALLVSVGTLAFQFWEVRTTEEDKETNAERTRPSQRPAMKRTTPPKGRYLAPRNYPHQEEGNVGLRL